MGLGVVKGGGRPARRPARTTGFPSARVILPHGARPQIPTIPGQPLPPGLPIPPGLPPVPPSGP